MRGIAIAVGLLILSASSARSDDEERAKVLMKSGSEAFAKKDYDRAHDDFDRARRLQPDRANPYRMLGLTAQLQGRCEEAVAQFDEYLKRVKEVSDKVADVIKRKNECREAIEARTVAAPTVVPTAKRSNSPGPPPPAIKPSSAKSSSPPVVTAVPEPRGGDVIGAPEFGLAPPVAMMPPRPPSAVANSSDQPPGAIVSPEPRKSPVHSPERKDRAGRGLRIAGLTLLGTGACIAVAGGVGFGSAGKDAFGQQLNSSLFEPDAEPGGHRYDSLMTASLIVGGVTAVTGAILLGLGLGSSGARPKSDHASLRVAPFGRAGLAGLSVAGAF